mmetsp:Transcript_1695/g.3090  ORF Transcript_1695/g.3090 Transcript_1695/m.3090 type:complete len:100 (-) Transcript_1695:15-314(-)
MVDSIRVSNLDCKLTSSVLVELSPDDNTGESPSSMAADDFPPVLQLYLISSRDSRAFKRCSIDEESIMLVDAWLNQKMKSVVYRTFLARSIDLMYHNIC